MDFKRYTPNYIGSVLLYVILLYVNLTYFLIPVFSIGLFILDTIMVLYLIGIFTPLDLILLYVFGQRFSLVKEYPGVIRFITMIFIMISLGTTFIFVYPII